MSHAPISPTDVTAAEFHGLARRVEQLESVIAEIQQTLQQRTENVAPPAPPVSLMPPPVSLPVERVSAEPPSLALPASPLPASPLPAAPLPAAPANKRSFDLVRDSEYLLNKIGIGLLLLGMAFLFKYSADQGWVTPLIRVIFGGVLGSGLIGLGLVLRRTRPHFGQVLQGGGIGALYLSIFAAYQLYALLPYPIAFGAMCGVTALTFGLAVSQNAQVLSVLAAVGGLATPFLLYTSSDNLSGLVVYTSVIAASSSALYLVRRWKGLLATAFVGTWLIFFLATDGLESSLFGVSADHWALQAGVGFAALAFWALPVFRAATRTDSQTGVAQQEYTLLNVLAVATPALSLGVSALIWSLHSTTWGFIVLGVAAVYAAVAAMLRPRGHIAELAYTHGVVALLLLTMSFVLLLEGDVLLFTLAAEAALIQYVATRSGNRTLNGLSHLLFISVAVWIAGRLVDSRAGLPVVNPAALTELAVLAVTLGATRIMRPRQIVPFYLGALHILLLAWLSRELGRLPEGNGLITVAWGLYGIILLVAGLRRDVQRLVLFGIGTLLLVLAKLFLIDLAELEAIWRIVLFIGFGGAFLVLSYFFQSLWRPTATPTPEDAGLPDQTV